MNYVYVLQSVSHPDKFYTGLCKDVAARLSGHNAGQSPHTSKFMPWRLRPRIRKEASALRAHPSLAPHSCARAPTAAPDRLCVSQDRP